MAKYVCIDPGHGGNDSGAVLGARYEKNDTLRFSMRLKEVLLKQDLKVLMTRESDKSVELIDRTNLANSQNVDLFISIHRNAFSTQDAKGVEVWTYTVVDDYTKMFAKNVLDYVVEVGVSANRGVKAGNYHVCRETKMPAVLLELGFITNPGDNDLFDTRFESYVKAVAKGIMKSLGLEYKEDIVIPPTPPTGGDILYKVQVGAFREYASAKRLSDELTSKGYPNFIVS